MLTKQIDGNTYTQCDCCKKFNILITDMITTVEVFEANKAKGTGYLLCHECSKKFKKMMEEFCDA